MYDTLQLNIIEYSRKLRMIWYYELFMRDHLTCQRARTVHNQLRNTSTNLRRNWLPVRHILVDWIRMHHYGHWRFSHLKCPNWLRWQNPRAWQFLLQSGLIDEPSEVSRSITVTRSSNRCHPLFPYSIILVRIFRLVKLRFWLPCSWSGLLDRRLRKSFGVSDPRSFGLELTHSRSLLSSSQPISNTKVFFTGSPSPVAMQSVLWRWTARFNVILQPSSTATFQGIKPLVWYTVLLGQVKSGGHECPYDSPKRCTHWGWTNPFEPLWSMSSPNEKWLKIVSSLPVSWHLWYGNCNWHNWYVIGMIDRLNLDLIPWSLLCRFTTILPLLGLLYRASLALLHFETVIAGTKVSSGFYF